MSRSNEGGGVGPPLSSASSGAGPAWAAPVSALPSHAVILLEGHFDHYLRQLHRWHQQFARLAHHGLPPSGVALTLLRRVGPASLCT